MVANSTWSWNGGSGSYEDSANWTLTSGPGNGSNIPAAFDTAVISAGTVFVPSGAVVTDETINVSGTTYLFNYGTMSADAGNTLSINVGATAEVFNVGQLVANGGTVVVNGKNAAIAGGYAPVLGAGIIEGGGTFEANYGYPAGVSGTVP